MIDTKMTVSKNVYICRRFRPPYVSYVPTLQGPEHGSRMPASARGDGRGSCRGH
ncbi:unnamed protein product, partial [Staurois parvus]